jgi:hypothetical protein
MNNKQLECFKQWFGDFIAGHYGDDEYVNANLQMKEAHTWRVCRVSRQITDSLNFNENDTLIAETVALFHDVGRFPQFVKYRTYLDQKSTNHSLLALEVLRENSVMDGLDDDERQTIETAIEFHGAKEIPPTLDQRTADFAKVIRDADKLDIYHIVIKNHKNYIDDPDNFKLEIEFPDEPYYSPEIVESIMNNQRVDYNYLRTLNDVKILQLGWIFDINFLATIRIIKENGYYEQIISFLDKDETAEKVARHVMNYVDQRLASE